MRAKRAQDALNNKLIEAASSGDVSGLRTLLDQGADPLAGDSWALKMAALRGHASCVEVLIPISDPQSGDSDALSWAAGGGYADCVRLLLSVSDIQAKHSLALVKAASGGHADCVALLIAGSDPWNEGSALNNAAQYGHADCLRLLLPVSNPLRDDGVALKSAARADHRECLEILLCAPIDWPSVLDMRTLFFEIETREKIHAAAALRVFIEARQIANACSAAPGAMPSQPKRSL